MRFCIGRRIRPAGLPLAGAAIIRGPMNDSSQRFDVLRASYAQSLASKYSALESAWHEFAAAPGAAALRDLHVLVHRLVGSAPAYGYAQLGDLARAADTQIAEWDNLRDTSRVSIDVLAHNLARTMRALLDALSQAAGEGGPPSVS
jgi:HPt (histidine-containing phosphotransfer) domain-containing protein